MINRKASQVPPENLDAEKVPMFVAFGFDDNGNSGTYPPNDKGGVKWATETFSSRTNPGDNTRCTTSFYFATYFLDRNKRDNEPYDELIKEWRNAVLAGHEAGNHTHSHKSGLEYSEEDWIEEISKCNGLLTGHNGIGLKENDIKGFRTPFLEFNNKTFRAVKRAGFEYDCSIEEGWQDDQDGTNFNWPYTLNHGSPGYTFCNDGEKLEPVEGLWEMPCYPVIIPPDELCEKYGVKPGFRKSKVGVGPDDEPYNPEDGKITGLDYNMYVSFKMTKAEFLATMKYTFDLRMAGNRCPFLFGAHSDFYSPWFNMAENATPEEMREGVEEFLDYVLSFNEVRVISNEKVLEWIKNPKALS